MSQLFSLNQPAFWIFVGTIFLMSVVLLTVSARVTPTSDVCVLTENQVNLLRNDMPLQRIVEKFESGYYDRMNTGSSYVSNQPMVDPRYDGVTGPTLLMDEFETLEEAWVKTQNAALRVENDRLQRDLDNMDPEQMEAFHLALTAQKLRKVIEEMGDDQSPARETAVALAEDLQSRLSNLGVGSELAEEAVILEHEQNRRMPLDDQTESQ